MISKDELKEMKERARNNQGNFWHGFISFNEQDSVKIDHHEKCFDLLKKSFPEFFKEAGFDINNIDLMCAMHLDKRSHYHIYYCFWEKEAIVKNPRAAGYIYQKKGKIPIPIITHMTERVNAFTLDDEIAKRRDEAIEKMKMEDGKFGQLLRSERIKDEMIALAKFLPKGSLYYGSKDMASYRSRIDRISFTIAVTNIEFGKKLMVFLHEVDKKEKLLKGKMKSYYESIAARDMYEGKKESDLIFPSEIKCMESLRYDYYRRLGNIVLGRVRFIQNNIFTYDKSKKYKMNDKGLKRKIAISNRKIEKGIGNFLSSVASLFSQEETAHSSRL